MDDKRLEHRDMDDQRKVRQEDLATNASSEPVRLLQRATNWMRPSTSWTAWPDAGNLLLS